MDKKNKIGCYTFISGKGRLIMPFLFRGLNSSNHTFKESFLFFFLQIDYFLLWVFNQSNWRASCNNKKLKKSQIGNCKN